MPRQVQFLTSVSVRGAAVYASGEIATFEDFIAADLIARGRAVAWPVVEPEPSGFSVFVDASLGESGGFSVFVDPSVEVVTDPQAIAAAMEDTVDGAESDDLAELPPDSDPAMTPVADPSTTSHPAADGSDSAVVPPARRGGRKARNA
ncbi:hypothetical protein [Luteitalea sp.]